jgi:hypothetical protein
MPRAGQTVCKTELHRDRDSSIPQFPYLCGMTTQLLVEDLNKQIKELGSFGEDISDGYHTFKELYEHRITLYIALCRMYLKWQSHYDEGQLDYYKTVWRSKAHSDGSIWDGWFLLGIGKKSGEQITYHLPLAKWEECNFAAILDKAPEFDGHTSEDVLQRLSQL